MGKQKKLLTLFNKEEYDILNWNGSYLLYSKTIPSNIANATFLASFNLSSDEKNYFFQDKYYHTPEELLQAIEEYNKTLPFNQEFYNPSYRKHYFMYLCLSEYLRKLGFTKHYASEDFVLYDQHEQIICLIKLHLIDDTTTGIIIRKIISNPNQQNLDKSTQAPFKDLDSALGALNSILVNYTSIVVSQLTNMLKDMSRQRSNLILDRTYDIKKHSETVEDNRQKTIQLLEEELKRLKEE